MNNPHPERFKEGPVGHRLPPVAGEFDIEVDGTIYEVKYRVDEDNQIQYLRLASTHDGTVLKLANLTADDRARLDAAIDRDAAAERQAL